MDYIFNVIDLGNDTYIVDSILLSAIIDQIGGYEKTGPDEKRYEVSAELFQGRQAPSNKLDDYIEPIIKSITHSNLFWFDSGQVDEFMIKKVLNPRLEKSKLRIQIRSI